MNSLLNKVVKVFRLISGLFPAKLPVGVSEFESFIQRLEDTYDLPTKDKDSIRFAVASIIMHLGPQAGFKPLLYFYLTLRSGAAKQVAGSVFYDIKTRQKEAAEQAAKSNELKQ